nr:MAG TPA: hypothetical protein [Caudoviricetes sp.]
MLQYDFRKGGFWFRVFGIGLSVINREIYPAPFSVRHGSRKELRVGKFGVKYLEKVRR